MTDAPGAGDGAAVLSDADLRRFHEGIDHFNSRRFWEAHESWEELWLEADAPLVDFYQGLIQLAAAYHHMQRGTFRGAVRLFESALRRLAPYPQAFLRLDRRAAEEAAREHAIAARKECSIDVEDYPKLTIERV